jgi:dihydrofolate reductase
MGQVLLMGRKTYESIGRPLPGRTTVVLSRSGFTAPGVIVAKDWLEAAQVEPTKTLFLAGGAALYEEALPWCAELILTHVAMEPEADAFFPDWTDKFDAGEVIAQHPTCEMRRHRPL